MHLKIGLLVGIIFLSIIGIAKSSDRIKSSQVTEDTNQQISRAPIGQGIIIPIPEKITVDPKKVALGLHLFEDKRLSRDNSTACRSCHLVINGADQKRFSPSIDGRHRKRNTPTIYNIGLIRLYGWYGMPNNLGDLSEAIIKSKKGMASSLPEIIKKISRDIGYIEKFSEIYSDGIQADNIKDALAEYMRSLITPNSRFDQYLRGNKNAISESEEDGYRLFQRYGCTSCHQGIAVGGNMVAPFNLFRNYLTPEHTASQLELGRYNVTNNNVDKYVFRVPSLRNIELTAPYLHDGSSKDLDSAVEVMGRYMLGRQIPKRDRTLMVDFLKTLTGDIPGK